MMAIDKTGATEDEEMEDEFVEQEGCPDESDFNKY